MGSTDDRIRVLIEARDEASATIKKVDRELQALGAGSSAVKSRIAAFGAEIAALAGPFAGFLSAMAAWRALTSAISAGFEEMANDIKAAVQFDVAMKSMGDTLGSTRQRADEFSKSMQATAAVGDDVVLSGMSLLATFGRLRGEGLERATRAALNLAATGVEVRSAFMLIARAAAGSTEALGRYGLKIDESIPEGERFNALLEKIEKNMGNLSQEVGQTAPGALQKFRLGLVDVAGALVGQFVKGLELSHPQIKLLGVQLQGAAMAISGMKKEMHDLTPAAKAARDNMAEFMRIISDPKLLDMRGDLDEVLKELGIKTIAAARREAELFAEAWKKLALAGKFAGLKPEEITRVSDALKKLADKADTLPEELKAIEIEFRSLGFDADYLAEAVERVTGTSFRQLSRELTDAQAQLEGVINSFDAGTMGVEQYEVEIGLLIERIHELEDNLNRIKGEPVFGEGKDPLGIPWKQIHREQETFIDLMGLSKETAADLGSEFVLAAVDGKAAMKDFYDNTMRWLAQMLIRAALLKLMTAAIGGSTGWRGGGLLGGTIQGGDLVPLESGDFASGVAGMPFAAAPIQVNALGVSRRFVEDFLGEAERLGRVHGVQVFQAR